MLFRTAKTAFLLMAASFLLLFSFPAPLYAVPVTPDTTLPLVSARSAIVVEYPSGRILYQKAAHARMPPASTTKILTAILALENGDLDSHVTVSPKDMVWGSKMGLRAGERQTVRNLLYGLMLPSGNDAALTIARHIGSQANASEPIQAFSGMMNTRLTELGLRDSHFVNPHGLDARGHYSSAYDLATLTWHAMHFPTFNEVVRQPFYAVPGHPLRNRNKMLLEYPGAEGVKTGYTGRAGLCLVTSATRDGRRLISVVLNAPKWVEDSKALLDYGFARVANSASAKGSERLLITTRK